MTRDDVAASQRGRLLDAVTQAVADKGYAATTVADIVDLAGVSRTTFYQHFAGKPECFLEAYQSGFDEALAHMNGAAAMHDGWVERLRASTASLLTTLAQAPDFARAFFIEVLAAGDDALARRTRIMAQFADAIAGNFKAASVDTPELDEFPRPLLYTVVGGVTELIARHVRARRFDELTELEPQVTEFMLAVLLGRSTAEATLAEHPLGPAAS